MWEKIVYIFIITIAMYILKQLFSETPNYVKYQSKFLAFYIWVIVTSFFLVPIFVLNPRSDLNALYGAHIIKQITKLLKIKWVLRNGKVLMEDRGAVIVSNHQSSMDLLGMVNIWHVAVRIAAVARKELFYIWPFGLSAYLAGVIFIDRNNSKDAYKTLKATSDVMIKNKTKLWLYPEGTRNKHSKKLLPFKNGAFSIAIAAQVPIIPVVISPYYYINSKKYIFNEGHNIIQCLEPVPTAGLTIDDIPKLRDEIKNIVENAYKELSDEVLSDLPPDYSLVTQD